MSVEENLICYAEVVYRLLSKFAKKKILRSSLYHGSLFLSIQHILHISMIFARSCSSLKNKVHLIVVGFYAELLPAVN